MRRKIAMIAALGGLVAMMGCQHIAGKADCGYHPSNYTIGAPTAAYPSFPVPALTPKEAPPMMPAPVSSDGEPVKDDTKPKDPKGKNSGN